MSRPFIPAQSTARCALHYTINNVDCYNIINVQFSHVVTAADLTSLFATLQGWHANNWKSAVANGAVWVGASARGLDTSSAPTLDYVANPTVAGAYGGSGTMSCNSAAVIQLQTGVAGRSSRGRIYVAGLGNGGVVNNVLTTAYQATLRTAYVALQSALQSASTPSTLCIVSYRTNKTWRVTAQVTPVTLISCSPWLGNQRDRLPGPGR